MEKLLQEPTSDDFILSKLNTRIIVYDDLKFCNNVDDLFINDSFIILYKGLKGPIGHWCCVVRRGNTLSYFDSFGRKPDDSLFFNDTYPYLSLLLFRSKYNLEYNEYNYQSKETSTCGHHCIVRILFKYKSLKDYQRFMDQFENDDEVVIAISNML